VLLGQPRPGLDSSPAFWSAYAPGRDNNTTNAGLWEALAFAVACCFLATAGDEESQYNRRSIRSFNFGGLTCVSYLLAQLSFRLHSDLVAAFGTTSRR
jgi:hypothetical protein